MAATFPQPFGKYTLLKRLAVGGMAEIFLAEHRGEAGFVRHLVIKRVLPNLTENAEFVTMFLDEARVLARLTHPNIVHTYDFGRVDGQYFLALEYVHGGNLRELMQRHRFEPFPLDHALFIISQTLAGLDHAHRARDLDGTPLKLVHRDISPANILISLDGAVKVTDFGIARTTVQQTHTAAYIVKGKLAYMSPEQISGQRLDARSDLFSVGVVLWELLAGRKLFPQENARDVQRAICEEPLPSLATFRPDIPDIVLDLISIALNRNPEERFQSAAAMQIALEACVAKCGLSAGVQQLARYMHETFPELVDQGGMQTDENAPTTVRDPSSGGHATSLLTDEVDEPRQGDTGAPPFVDTSTEGSTGQVEKRPYPAGVSPKRTVIGRPQSLVPGGTPGPVGAPVPVGTTVPVGTNVAVGATAAQSPSQLSEPFGSPYTANVPREPTLPSGVRQGALPLEQSLPQNSGDLFLSQPTTPRFVMPDEGETEAPPRIPRSHILAWLREQWLIVSIGSLALCIAAIALWLMFHGRSQTDALEPHTGRVVVVADAPLPPLAQSADASAHQETLGNTPSKVQSAPGKGSRSAADKETADRSPAFTGDRAPTAPPARPAASKQTPKPARGPSRSTPPGEPLGLLSIQARPAATVVLDGKPLGDTPIYRRRITSGWHDLELRAPGLRPVKRRVYVPPDRELKNTFELVQPKERAR